MLKIEVRFFEENHNGQKKQCGSPVEFIYVPGLVSLYSQAYLRANQKQRLCNNMKVRYL